MQTIIYVGCGLFLYFGAMIVVSGIAWLIFDRWATKKFGPYYEYSANKAIGLYYADSGFYHEWADWVVGIALWPIMVPLHYTRTVKALKRLLHRYNY